MSKEKTNLKLVIGGLICIKPRVKTSGQFLDGKLKSSWTAILWPDSANASRVSMSSRLFQDDSSRLSMFSGWCLRTWKFEKYILFFSFLKKWFQKKSFKKLTSMATAWWWWSPKLKTSGLRKICWNKVIWPSWFLQGRYNISTGNGP